MNDYSDFYAGYSQQEENEHYQELLAEGFYDN